MTDDTPVNLAAHEPSVTSFEATVRSVEDRDVTLDQTYFYAEGGGQPADRGTLGGVDVVDVQTVNGVTVHTLVTEPDFDTGTTVSGALDGSFRTYTMRAHTASHIVYGVGRTLFGDHGYGGFDIGEDTVRLDFETSGDADALDAATVQRQANQAVWDGRSVEWYEMDAAEAESDDDIVFNLRDDADLTETVRIVEIDGWDISACGGTHVARTVEVGPIEVVDVSNPGANLVRVEYAVGESAIDRQIAETRAATRAADTLDTSVEGLPRRAENLLSENTELKTELADLREELLSARIDSLTEEPVTRGSDEWVVGTVDGVGPNTVSDQLADREIDADTMVLTGRDGQTFVVVATDGGRDANEVIGDITDQFGGGGGGQPTLAQGGGLDAEPETVVESLKSE